MGFSILSAIRGARTAGLGSGSSPLPWPDEVSAAVEGLDQGVCRGGEGGFDAVLAVAAGDDTVASNPSTTS